MSLNGCNELSGKEEHLRAKETSADYKYFNFYPINNSDGMSSIMFFL